MTDRNKPGVAFWASADLFALLYVLSYPAAHWLLRNDVLPAWMARTVLWLYFPIYWLVSVNAVAAAAMDWYYAVLFHR
jgi:hypothetical protein